MAQGHTCNPWCFDKTHAVLFDPQGSERGNLDAVARVLASYVGDYIGFQEVNPPGVVPGTPSQLGVARSRVVAWARGR